MIAFIFALLAVAMLLALRRHVNWANTVFAAALVLATYWLYFHATSTLTINL